MTELEGLELESFLSFKLVKIRDSTNLFLV